MPHLLFPKGIKMNDLIESDCVVAGVDMNVLFTYEPAGGIDAIYGYAGVYEIHSVTDTDALDFGAYCRRKRTFIIGHLRSRGGRAVSFKPSCNRQALRSGGCEDSAPMLLPWKGGVSLERLSSCIIEDTEVNASRIRTSVRLPRGMGDGKLYLMLGNSLSPLITEVIGNAILGDML